MDYKSMSDFELAQIAQCDNNAFEELYNRYSQIIKGVVRKLTKNEQETSDICQEVFIKIFQRSGTFRGESTFSTWVHSITKREVNLFYRRQRRFRDQPTDKESEIQWLQDCLTSSSYRNSDGLKETMERIINELPMGYKRAVILIGLLGLTHQEISLLHGCSVSNSKTQWYRARRRVIDLYESSSTNIFKIRGKPKK